MRLTASRLGLGRSCLWWARPDVDVPAGETSAAAAVGTSLHAVAERESEEVDGELVDSVFRDMTHEPMQDTPLLRPADQTALEQLVASWRAWWATWSPGLTGVEREQPYALDVVTGKARVLPSNGQRDYSAATSTEVCGTTDLVAVRGSELIVLDYKTGFSDHRYRDHEEQMRFLGAAAALEHGVSRVRVIVAHVTADGVRLDERVLDSLDIAIVVQELRALVAGVDDAIATPGLHCEEDWCPAKAVCPVTRALLVEAKMPLDQKRHLSLVGPIQSNDQAYATLVGIDLLEEWIEQRKKDVREFAAATPVVAPDGRVFKGRSVKRETPRIDVAGAEEALATVLGADGAKEAVEVKRSTTWTAIKRVARGRNLPISDTEEHARAALRQAGALKVSEFTSFEWKAGQ